MCPCINCIAVAASHSTHVPFDDGVQSPDLQQIALVVFFHSVNCRKHSTCTHGGYSLQLVVVVYILKVLANMLHALQHALVVVVVQWWWW